MTEINQRRAPRFDLHLCGHRPVEGMSYGVRETPTISREASSNGIYLPLGAPASLKDDAPVEVEMTLPNEITLSGPVRVRCLGHVQRRELGGVAVAIDKYEFRPNESALNLAPSR